MATSQQWCEYNGATPTETNGGSFTVDCYWKAVDNCTGNGGTVYTAAPVPAGTPSMWKIHSLKFTGGGASASLSALKFSLNTNGNATLTSTPHWNVLAAIPAATTFFYANGGTPAALGTIGGTSPSSLPVTGTGSMSGTWGTSTFSGTTTGPFSVAGGSTPSLASGANLYTTALYTQLQTNAAASPGPITDVSSVAVSTLTATWTES